MARFTQYGFAQIEPQPDAWFFKWKVWYFKYGETETRTSTVHMRHKTALKRAEWWAKQPHTAGISGDE